MGSLNRVACVGIAALSWWVVAFQGSVLLADQVTIFDRWYVVMLEDQPAGWMHTSVHETAQPAHLTTATEMQITVRRGPVTLQIGIESRFVETPQGRPIEAQSTQLLGRVKIVNTIRFDDDTIEWTSSQGELEQRRVLPYPQADTTDQIPGATDGRWLTPIASHRYMKQKLAAGADEFRYWSVDPALGAEPYETRLKIRGRENTEVFGKVVPAIVCDLTLSNLPGMVSRVYLDPEGWEVKSKLPLIPGMTMTLVQADQQLATSRVNPPELLAATLIKPDHPIDTPRQLRRATYELTLSPNGPKPSFPTLLSQGVQRVEMRGPQTARVIVDLAHRDNNILEEQAAKSCLEATTMLNTQDPKILDLLQHARSQWPANATPAQQAEGMRRFVHRYITAKDLSVGLATASEVARTAQGDCTEHAVLLAAMLRAAGIPSRTVSGLIYVDRFLGQEGVFGYHMWTQAWLAPAPGGTPDPGIPATGRWVDLDATLDGVPFDAAHIALAANDMSNGHLINDMMGMIPLMGRLKIKVVDTASHAAPTTP